MEVFILKLAVAGVAACARAEEPDKQSQQQAVENLPQVNVSVKVKADCAYDNPPCQESQICQNNKCFEHILSSGGGGY